MKSLVFQGFKFLRRSVNSFWKRDGFPDIPLRTTLAFLWLYAIGLFIVIYVFGRIIIFSTIAEGLRLFYKESKDKK